MSKAIKDLLIISIATLFLTLLIWLPHLFRVNLYNLDFSQGTASIYNNYDGLEYIVIAKSFYHPAKIALIPQALQVSYFPAHFPGYPLIIALFAPLFGFLKSMLFASVIFTIFSAITFYFLLRKLNLTSHPLWLSVVFLLLPARWLVVHSVGSPEPMFIFFIISSIYFFKRYEDTLHKSDIWIAGISIGLAQITKPPGILLFIALGIYLLFQLIRNKISFSKMFSFYPILLGPLTLLGVFYLFQIQLSDFWAYFHTGDNIHLTFPPFQVFNQNQFWVGSIWLEDIIYIFILGLLGGLLLLKSELKVAGFFVLTFLVATSLVAHRDIARYSLPIFPFVLIAFEKVITTKEFKIVMVIIALALYLYTENFLLGNTAPIPNLLPYN